MEKKLCYGACQDKYASLRGLSVFPLTTVKDKTETVYRVIIAIQAAAAFPLNLTLFPSPSFIYFHSISRRVFSSPCLPQKETRTVPKNSVKCILVPSFSTH